MANFRIIEGDDLFESVKKDFIQLYDKGVKIKDIQKQLGLTTSQYMNFFHRLRRSGEITQLRNPRAGKKTEKKDHYKKNPKYYSYNHYTKRWHVVYHSTYYACFFKREQAERFVSLMMDCDWDKSRARELKWKVIKGE